MSYGEATSGKQDGIHSILDTDLYKLTMQCAVLKWFPDAEVSYAFNNRTPDLKFTRRGFEWLKAKINELTQIHLTPIELGFLKSECPYFSPSYLTYLYDFRFRPEEHLKLTFTPIDKSSITERTKEETNKELNYEELGEISIHIQGKWVDTILYEIPLLILVSECYFKFTNTDWNHSGQTEKAYDKAMELLNSGCCFSEFGTRRRRSYYTQELVIEGLIKARDEYVKQGGTEGKFLGTSNVHFAERFGLTPIGTVAHEWFMGIAAITGDYKNATELALREWVSTFGEGTLGIALTDTFGTEQFLKSFSKVYVPPPPPSHNKTRPATYSHLHTRTISRPAQPPPTKTFAEIFKGVRQDSGDPEEFIKTMRRFYDEQGIKEKPIIVFSDSLDVESCKKYKAIADKA
ncbi:nicotinate phosphoribosyltransferase, partial [Rhizina undulata]